MKQPSESESGAAVERGGYRSMAVARPPHLRNTSLAIAPPVGECRIPNDLR